MTGRTGAGQTHDSGQVHSDYPFPRPVVHLPEWEEVIHDPGHVGQDVDLVPRGGYDLVDIFLVSDVGPDHPMTSANLVELTQSLLEPFFGNVAGDHRGALVSHP